ncbi:hypothetical protein NKDENANG_01649 [Candidatus Entotheonellaceae bacterium PAL068K]
MVAKVCRNGCFLPQGELWLDGEVGGSSNPVLAAL